ncbi:UDP-N-acetylmuramate--L-alanine ligase [Georgenia satyanarayanai]|uniref:UDP-N-acetylmuramate--L-alanine ligase n=1 Tax=Georgenia satyanarayanai TaxID=860221 RepID=UPI00203F0521|nr:UDP-N-acetylmuramate--L-alanine ligase [Georgenia satyanarayanai]MCM3661837.1 UDP-N-acetylmuramate--L-alanine ligase [Georgenia satyanarayanai]
MSRYHLIGIGGAGMAPVAELLAARGLEVSGSDARDSATLERLRGLGVRAHAGHDAAQVPAGATVVVSTAVRPDNPELVRARELGLPVVHRSEALVVAAGDQDFVAVAGAHGKTTTSAMLAVALTEVGADPSYAIGGHVAGLGTGAHLGTGRAFVAEADESDGSFLNYRPAVAVVTNVEPDHLDHYGSREAFEQAFVDFAARVTGLLVACADDDGALRLARHAPGRVLTYGTGAAPGVGEGHVRIAGLTVGAAGAFATLERAGEPPVRLELAVTGAHNVRNATAAWCAGVALGAEPQALATALGAFRGTGRRFEARGEVAGVRVVDDYAHHPTEVAATLAAARLAAGEGRVVVLFQPHLYSRTQTFAAEFAAALGAADEVVVTDVYAAREDPVAGVDGSLITALAGGARYVADRQDAAAAVASLARPGDLVLTMGAGDVTELAPRVLALLAERA